MQDRKLEIIKKFKEAQNRLVLQASDLSLGTIAAMVKKNAIDIEPDYQRRERWNKHKQCALIESFILNVPVPPIYLAEDVFGKYSVVDGKQRIVSIHRFMTNDLRLEKLAAFPELNGMKVDEIPDEIRNALEIRPYVRVVTLLQQSDPSLKYEVFTRLNLGGEPMFAQELRNAMFRGTMNTMITKLSENSFLRSQMKIRGPSSSAYRTMSDVEMVLRFLTLQKSWREFSGDFRVEMDDFLRSNQNPPEVFLDKQKQLFDRSISVVEAIWGPKAFRRPTTVDWRDQFLAGMYDCQMVAVSEMSDYGIQKVINRKEYAVECTRNLFSDPQYEQSVREATNTPSRIRFRIEKTINMLNSIAE